MTGKSPADNGSKSEEKNEKGGSKEGKNGNSEKEAKKGEPGEKKAEQEDKQSNVNVEQNKSNEQMQQDAKGTAVEGGDNAVPNAATTITMPQAPSSAQEQPGFRAEAIALGPFISDILIFIVLGLLFTIIPIFALQPYRRGFFCNDQSIRYPYKDSTIPTVVLYVISMAILLVTIIGTELFRIIKLSESITYSLRGKNVNRFLIRFLTYFAHGIFGLLLNLIFTQTTKWMVGRLRPHFIDVCKPNITLSTCSNPNEYITNYVCNGASKGMIKEARLSFFSGHSAFCMGTAVFCVIYMQARLPRRIYGITLLPVLQGFLIGIALLVGLSRIADNMHHWSDVLTGFLVGCATGYYSAVILAKVFERTDVSFKREECHPLGDSGGQGQLLPANTIDSATTMRTTYSYPITRAASSSICPTQVTANQRTTQPTVQPQSTVLLTTEALGGQS
ncbi:Uncharacterized protein T28D9.3 [Toxocara canis]|uniref:Uncharacterized protein T28D9.3 n=1 Tax=Toxocara canis TaxID=6265 RepID=A0A0B2V8N6_TOXCA|nr:Uncharacterized protein T28D9.3 [Toxocara canis]